MDPIGMNSHSFERPGDIMFEPSALLSTLVLYTIVGSALGFQCCNTVLNFTPTPEKYLGEKRYKWRNIVTSFLHACISGSSSIFCLYRYPEILEDLINNYTIFSEVLVAVSIGYFAYDFIDIVYYKGFKDWPLLLHHVIIFLCFGISVYRHNYIGYAVVSLLGEINSTFLHFRQILLMANVAKSTLVYRANCHINLATFVVFRFGVLLWMVDWLRKNYERVPVVLTMTATFGLLAMVIINMVLFYRLVCSDVFVKERKDKSDDDVLEESCRG